MKKDVPLHAMKAPGGERRYSSYSFSTSALDGVSGQHQPPAALYPRKKNPRYPLDRRLGGPRAGLDAKARRKILCFCRGSYPGRSVRSQILYWLSYPGSNSSWNYLLMKKICIVRSAYFDNKFYYKVRCYFSHEIWNFKIGSLVVNCWVRFVETSLGIIKSQ
jgi:hypothetical protein